MYENFDTTRLVQCPRCDLGGDIGCPCCGGEGVLEKGAADDYVAREESQTAHEEAVAMSLDAHVDYMLSLREASHAEAGRAEANANRNGAEQWARENVRAYVIPFAG